MDRKTIPINISRQLWAQCGGYCQRPTCNKWLFTTVGASTVSIANVAHIIGSGSDGPRSEHELAKAIEKDGIGNLLMLCLECHKVIDELEKHFSVEQLCGWKTEHAAKIGGLFDVPTVANERELLLHINELLDINAAIFKEYGPYSEKAIAGDSGDALVIWRRRSVDTILPNNQRILDIFEKNKKCLPYPWDGYKLMLDYKMHADAFRDNCLLGQRVNDYKLFPLEFDHFVKTRLGIETPPLATRGEEELEYRTAQVEKYIGQFLVNHDFIQQMEQLDIANMVLDLKDGRTMRVFVTNTYYFTEYTFEQVMRVNPEIDAIICSNPAGRYADSAKKLCIGQKVGLFMLGEFMGALRFKGDRFVNYLLKGDRELRINDLKHALRHKPFPSGLQAYVFGSYLRQKAFDDIDIMIVYSNEESKQAVDSLRSTLTTNKDYALVLFDFTVCSVQEFSALQLDHDNMTRIA